MSTTLEDLDGRNTTHLHFAIDVDAYGNTFLAAKRGPNIVMTFSDPVRAAALADMDDALDINSGDIEDIAAGLKRLGVDCTVEHNDLYPICWVPGYGGIWLASGYESRPPIWKVQSPQREDKATSIGPGELLDDLIELIDEANK